MDFTVPGGVFAFRTPRPYLSSTCICGLCIRQRGTSYTDTHVNAFKERQCLSKSLQANIEDIVESIIFTGSELPDQLAEDSCITDDESSDLRNIQNRKDQVRVLVSIIKGRDLRVLHRFIKRIKESNKEVADNILSTFENYKSTLKPEMSCACCQMTTYVNVKYVVDGLWSINAISDALFGDIARSSQSSTEQKQLWLRVIDSLNNADNNLRENAYKRLIRALSNKHHYIHIAEGIEKGVGKAGKLECKCRVKFCPPSGSLSGVTSISPWSSPSEDRASSIETLSHTSEITVGTHIEAGATDDEDIEAPKRIRPKQKWPGQTMLNSLIHLSPSDQALHKVKMTTATPSRRWKSVSGRSQMPMPQLTTPMPSRIKVNVDRVLHHIHMRQLSKRTSAVNTKTTATPSRRWKSY